MALALCAASAPAARRTARTATRVSRSGSTQGQRLGPLARHPVVALTFDDLPAAGGLPPGDTRTEILTQLAKELRADHLEGTYGFVTAEDLEGDPDAQQALRDWVKAGMRIGNHTWSHPELTGDSAAAYEQNIARDEPALRAYSEGHDWHWFRFPYLEEGDTIGKREDVRVWLEAHGYRIAEVTLNFEDDDWDDAYDRCLARQNDAEIAWLRQSYMANAAEFLQVGREEEQIAFGHEIPNVLLLHATAFTTLMLPDLVHLLRQQGFRFASLPRVERNPAYAMDADAGLPDGGPLTNQFLNARHLQYPPFQPEPTQRLDIACR
jgi:peptidoglycan/xylan/chitin deacetylase (PgdA/CDA1 family)